MFYFTNSRKKEIPKLSWLFLLWRQTNTSLTILYEMVSGHTQIVFREGVSELPRVMFNDRVKKEAERGESPHTEFHERVSGSPQVVFHERVTRTHKWCSMESSYNGTVLWGPLTLLRNTGWVGPTSRVPWEGEWDTQLVFHYNFIHRVVQFVTVVVWWAVGPWAHMAVVLRQSYAWVWVLWNTLVNPM